MSQMQICNLLELNVHKFTANNTVAEDSINFHLRVLKSLPGGVFSPFCELKDSEKKPELASEPFLKLFIILDLVLFAEV